MLPPWRRVLASAQVALLAPSTGSCTVTDSGCTLALACQIGVPTDAVGV